MKDKYISRTRKLLLNDYLSDYLKDDHYQHLGPVLYVKLIKKVDRKSSIYIEKVALSVRALKSGAFKNC